MKKNIIIPLFALLTLICWGCKEEYVPTDITVDTVMEPVAGLQAESFISSVILTWDMPENENYYYTLISYTDAEGNQVNRKVSKYSLDPENENRVRALIGGFTDTNEYEFTLTNYSFANNASESVKVKGTPQPKTMAKEYIAKSVKFAPGIESATVTWDNSLGADIQLVMSWKDYFNYETSTTADNLPVLSRTVEATTPHTEVINSLPVETDCEVEYYIIDKETGEKSETLTSTFQVLAPIEDVYNPAFEYFPDGAASLQPQPDNPNQMTIEWKGEFNNEFDILTTGGDPYIYVNLKGKPAGKTLVFRYKSVQNITYFEIFFKGNAPASAKDEVVIKLPDTVDKSGYYTGLRKTNGFWKTVRVNLEPLFQSGFDYDGLWVPEASGKIVNRNRIRIDFGGQNKRELHFRNMHFE